MAVLLQLLCLVLQKVLALALDQRFHRRLLCHPGTPITRPDANAAVV